VERLCVRLRFHGDLNFFVRSGPASGEITRELKEPTSVKDVIESCGLPHPEVDRILIGNNPVDFRYVLREDTTLDVYPVGFDDPRLAESAPLQQRVVDRFVADGHLGKLSRNLRLLGLDVRYDPAFDDRQLLQISETDQRALLTRDRRLLMHGIVGVGYCPRSSNPMEQTVEVVRRFQPNAQFKPFTRCLQCNAPLQQVDKAAVFDQLEVLTRLYYDEFRSCTGCAKIYWRGSHFTRLESMLAQVRVQTGGSDKVTKS
jgi:uncharacterized protein with PIN domain